MLSGYVKLTEHGYTLPCFSKTLQPNAWYVAVCSVSGDHLGTIAGFDLYESGEIMGLAHGLVRTLEIGDPWHDVFLWDGHVHVGTAEELWDELESDRGQIAATAPITLLDLALNAGRGDQKALATAAFDYLEHRYGTDKAESWCRETLFLQRFLVLLRRLGSSGLSGEAVLAARDIEVTADQTGAYTVCAPASIKVSLDASGQMDIFRAGLETLAAALSTRFAGFDFEPASRSVSPAAVQAVVRSEVPQAVAPDPGQPGIGMPDQDILIIVAGARARQIGRHLTLPEWLPGWKGPGGRPMPYALTRHGKDVPARSSKADRDPRSAPAPAVHIVDGDSALPELDRYGVVVVLADDEFLFSKKTADARSRLLGQARRSRRSVSLLAPALPHDEPSRALARDPIDDPRTAFICDAMIDTSIARSPFWTGNLRRAIDRRTADVVVGAALLCAGASPVAEALKAHRPGVMELLLTFAFTYPYPRSRDRVQALGMASESTWSDAGIRAALEQGWHFEGLRLVDTRASAGASGSVELRSRRTDFEAFAHAVVSDLEVTGGAPGSTVDRRRAVPRPILQALRFEHLSAGMDVSGGGRKISLGLTAEAPSIEAVRHAADAGWVLARYTDTETIMEVLHSGGAPHQLILPRDMRHPNVRRIHSNRGLATRGIDSRDVVRVRRDHFEQWSAKWAGSSLLRSARRYRTSIGMPDPAAAPSSSEFVLPWSEVRAEYQAGDQAARALAAILGLKVEAREAAPNRPADLQAAWSAPGASARRFLIADGVLPSSLSEIAADEVPSQNMFIVEGDASVPALLSSRLFRVWARATLSRSTSWMARFTAGKTFEAFPLPEQFEVERSHDGLARLCMRGSGILAGLIAEADRRRLALNVRWRMSGSDRRGTEAPDASLQEEIDGVLLRTVGLDHDASDLDLLEHMLLLNRNAAAALKPPSAAA